MASLLKSNTFSSLRAHHLQATYGLLLESISQLHLEPGAREKFESESFYENIEDAREAHGGEFGRYYSLPSHSDSRIDRLPFSIRLLMKSPIRNCDEFQVTVKDVEKILDWQKTSPNKVEIPFKPARVLLQVD